MLKPAVFLDRDGTINIEKNYLFRIEDFMYMEGAVEGIRMFAQMGYQIVIITNQSGIARGFYGEKDFLRLSRWMKQDLSDKGICVAGIYYCPHHPMAAVPAYRCRCGCRKPGTELFWRAQRELGIDMGRSIAIGDKERDLCICKESGVTGFLVGNEETILSIAEKVRRGIAESNVRKEE